MMRTDELRPVTLFDGLTDAQLAELAQAGEEMAIPLGTDLFHEGEPADSWWVLVSGAIELHRQIGREDTVVGMMDVPGRWAGGFRAWDPHGRYLASGRGVSAGTVFRISSSALRELSMKWFPFTGHLLDGVYGTARHVETIARQRESLVTLGTLSAGLAHELNNPAAAATRAVDALETACRTVLSSLGRLADGQITANQFSALDDLRSRLSPSSVVSDPMAVADQEDALSAWMDRHSVDEDWLLVPPLASAGATTDWCDQVAGVLPAEALQPGLEWVASTFSVETLLSEVKESTGRIMELVSAVRSYSQMDRGSLQHIDITEGLDTTLVMLGHKLRDGVEVVRSYAAEVPMIDAYAGELNQVWTNLIDNAVDAMEGHGTLRVSTASEPGHVVVEIADTGSGMSPEVAARAFDAFFTTKDVGSGTGLGLDIARRIVADRHGGTISIESEPGNTVLRVRLPHRPPER